LQSQAVSQAVPQKVPLLEMRHVSKTFGANKVLDNVRLQVEAGEIHALMGENGAGKSTLMKILSGAYTADLGSQILIDGQDVMSIAVIYQELALAPNLSVAQNIYMGHEKARLGVVKAAEMRASVLPVLERLGVTFSPDALVGTLPLGARQMVEIARALVANARIIVMDEPTTSLSSRETDILFDVINQLKRDGIAIIYISHRMEEVYHLADRVSVLCDGRYIGTLEREEISAPRLISMMIGRDLSSFYTKERKAGETGGRVLFSVRGLGDETQVHDCSFDIHEGEIFGVFGLVGAGRTELARLIFGADKKTKGEISLLGKKLEIANPSQALQSGIAYLTEDRRQLGLFLDMSVAENITIAVAADDCKAGGLLDFAKAQQRTRQAVQALSIRAASIALEVGHLSGGNQQKVLLARLLEKKPKLVILDEPTKGVDVGAKSEIYRIITELSQSGVAVMVISSDLPELIGIADRVMVMRGGRICGEVGVDAHGTLPQEEIMALAIGSGAARDGASIAVASVPI